jgi:transcriptional regulator with XRE-family HTH domain
MQSRTAGRSPLDHRPAELRRRRIELGRRQYELAEAAGISAGHLSELESGRRNPSPELLVRLAEALGCATADLMAEPA